MKKLLITLTILLTTATVVFGEGYISDDRPIAYEQLPTTAKQFIKTHFPEAKVALTTTEREMWGPKYEVIFTDGTKIEFLSSGEWDNIDCKYTRVPDAVIPAAILAFVKQNHPENFITEIDKERIGYEVNLNNSIDLYFTLNGQFRGYDD
jgi:hypothetical protein